jgi:hypothetical protein
MTAMTEREMYCKECGYQLNRLSSSACPECGHPFDPQDSSTFTFERNRRARLWIIRLYLWAMPFWQVSMLVLSMLIFNDVSAGAAAAVLVGLLSGLAFLGSARKSAIFSIACAVIRDASRASFLTAARVTPHWFQKLLKSH